MTNYKTYKEIPGAIINRKNFKGSSVEGAVRSDWYYIYSYDTIIGIVLANDAGLVLNVHHYSPTTSKIQNILRRIFDDAPIYEVNPTGKTLHQNNMAMINKADDVAISDY